MKRTLGIDHPASAGILLVLVAIAGCGASSPEVIKHVSSCGGLSIPSSARLISHYEDSHFRYQTLEVVVDLPAGEVADFKSRSGFEDFEPGVPADWRTKYWQHTSDSTLLGQDAGNEHSPAPAYPTRFVVIHDGGGDTRRVFIRAEC